MCQYAGHMHKITQLKNTVQLSWRSQIFLPIKMHYGICAKVLSTKLFITISIYPSLQATGARIGTMISALFNLGTGIIISFIYGWALTLLVLAFLPLIVIASAVEWKIMEGGAEDDKATKETAGKVSQRSNLYLAKFSNLNPYTLWKIM